MPQLEFVSTVIGQDLISKEPNPVKSTSTLSMFGYSINVFAEYVRLCNH